MRYHYEKVLAPPGVPFRIEYNCGPVLDCVFHVHPEYELTLVESGFGTRFIGASLEPFAELDLMLTGGMVPHHYLTRRTDSTGPEWSRTWVVKFLPDFCGRDLWLRPEASAVQAMLANSNRGLHAPPEIARIVQVKLRDLSAVEGFRRMIGLLDILELLARSPLRPLNLTPPPSTLSPPDERLNLVLGFIHRRLESGEGVALADVAAVACMTPPAFSGYFRKATRRCFIDYVLELKLNHAVQLLIRTDRSILDISQIAGFANLSNFNRRFRAVKGISPREYRQAHRLCIH